MEVTVDQITWYRLRRSGLVEPFDSPETCAREMAGMQAQIHSASGLALWNRTRDLDLHGFEAKLYDERSLVKIWGQRGTLHVYSAEDWPLIVGSRENRPTWWERSIIRKGGSTEGFHAIVDRVREIAKREGTVSRSRLARSWIDWDIGVDVDLLPSWGGVFAHLVCDGSLCHIRPSGGEGRFAHRTHWLPALPWSRPTPEQANTELARRYLHTFGPSTIQDYGYWRGIPIARAREGFTALGNDVGVVWCGGDELLILKQDLVDLKEVPPPKQAWPVKLLYRFDPLLLGHRDKSWIIDMKHYDKVWITGGHINGTILVGGRIQGTWNYRRKSGGKGEGMGKEMEESEGIWKGKQRAKGSGSGAGKGGGLDIEVKPFRKFGQRLVRKVEREARGVAGFFGLEPGEIVWSE